MVLDYTENIKKLISADSVYEGYYDDEVSGANLYRYNCGLLDIKRWLRSVLTRELSESNYEAARVILHLPLEDLEVRVGTEIDVKLAEVLPYDYNKISCSAGQVFEKGTPELLSTLLGEMDIYTYKAILEDKNNPVRLLYQYFISMIEKAHQITGSSGVLNRAILKEHKLQDDLMLYRMDSILHSVAELFTDGY